MKNYNSPKATQVVSKVYWITGLSGAGKSTIAAIFHEHLNKINQNTILLDGDILREIFGNNKNYKLREREKLSLQYSKLAKVLSSQGYDVIMSTISMFHSIRAWNRKNITNYVEIFLEVPMDVLVARDQKNLYSRALKGEIQNVIGVDLDAELPLNPDLIINNDGSKSAETVAEELLNTLNFKK